MNLFINTISTNAIIILFDNSRKIIDSLEFIIKWNESSLLIPKIDLFIKKNEIIYNDIENIVCVNWPWSFTWVRTTVLAINSINYITKNYLTPLNYFSLYDKYPIIKSSSKRDCFVKFNPESEIEIIENEKIIEIIKEKNLSNLYWSCSIEGIEIIEKIDYISIIKDIKLERLSKIEPLYIKKPNIC